MENTGLIKLISKLISVMQSVHRIPKNGFNAFHKYPYATEADVSEHLRSALSDNKIFMLSSIEEISSREIKTKSGNTEAITRVKIKCTFLCGETGANIEFIVYGEGQDAGDKGVYKAITGGIKYALMKNFLIPTGDDPDGDNPDSNTKNSGAKNSQQSKPKSEQPKSEQSKQEQDKKTSKPKTEQQLSEYRGYIKDLEIKNGTTNGRNWECAVINTEDGNKYGSFDTKVHDKAVHAFNDGLPVIFQYKKNAKGSLEIQNFSIDESIFENKNLP